MPVYALVLLAAVLHATWNAMLRGGTDRLWSMTVMNVATAAFCSIAVFLVPLPLSVSWVYAVASATLHVGYNRFLVTTYQHGDFGQTYPIARGSSPVLVTLGAATFAGELPRPISIVGVLLVSGGIISLAFERRSPSRAMLSYALGTGAFIGAYSVTDGIGVRLSGNPVSYTLWMELVAGILFSIVYLSRPDRRSIVCGPRETSVAAAGGLISILGYGIIIYAMSKGAMGAVSALRETSVVFAAIIGALFLRERLTIFRSAACIVIAFGAFLIAR